MPYYFNPQTEESVWVEPKDATVVDRTTVEPAEVISKDQEISDYLAH